MQQKVSSCRLRGQYHADSLTPTRSPSGAFPSCAWSWWPGVRIGVGRPPGRKDPADYVLEPIAKRDAEDFAVLVERAADATMDLVHLPLERAQDRHNH